MPVPIALLVPVLTAIGQGVVDQFIDEGAGKQLASFAFDVLNSGSAVEVRLQAILDHVQAKKAEAEAAGTKWVPEQSEIDALWAEINARDADWAEV